MAASPVVTEATLHGLNEHLVISVGEWQRRKESSEFIVFQVRSEKGRKEREREREREEEEEERARKHP